MPPAVDIFWPKTFEGHFKELIGKYPKSEQAVRELITDTLPRQPDMGDRYPGFSPHSVLKLRIALKEYRLSKRKGLRLLYLLADSVIVPVMIYKKGKPKQEHMIKSRAKELLQSINEEITKR